MARIKLSEEQKAAKAKEELEAHVARSLISGKKELVERYEWGFIKPPTRQFEIGEEVVNGGHDRTTIVEKDLDGAIYLVDNHNTKNNTPNLRWTDWVNLYKKRSLEEMQKLPRFEPSNDIIFNYHQSSISAFDTIVYHFGLDLNPDYQRDLVWELEDKLKLIDSIFNNVDIGKFAFIRRGYDKTLYPTPHMYEVLDGKQRMTAIMEFKEDRFKWRGFFFSELHPHDKWFFESYKISVAEIDGMTKEQIYRYFLKLNTGGKPIAVAHLNKVQGLLEAEQNKK